MSGIKLFFKIILFVLINFNYSEITDIESASVSEKLLFQPEEPFSGWRLTCPFPSFDLIRGKKNYLPVYGIYSWCHEYSIYRSQILDIGWKTLRLSGDIDVNENSSDERILKQIFTDGLEVIYTLTPGDRGKAVTDDVYISEYLGRLSKILNRYGPEGSFWTSNPEIGKNYLKTIEICNEPNFQYMWKDGSYRQKISLYAKLLSESAAFIRKNRKWNDVKIAAFGTGGARFKDADFIYEVLHDVNYRRGSFDILTTHPYVDPNPPEAGWKYFSIPEILEQIRIDSGLTDLQSSHIWYTELGWKISKKNGGRYNQLTASVTPRLQAAYSCRMYVLAMRMGVERVTNMFICDTDGYNGGFLNTDGSFRESGIAVRNMISMLPNPVFLEAISDGTCGEYIYIFDPDGSGLDRVFMAWNSSGKIIKKIHLPWTKYTVTDMLGSKIHGTSSDGICEVVLGPCPVYISEN